MFKDLSFPRGTFYGASIAVEFDNEERSHWGKGGWGVGVFLVILFWENNIKLKSFNVIIYEIESSVFLRCVNEIFDLLGC